ncbi:MAG: transglycosylase SLT domain-containing protein [Gammaproteobacteria bacterium]|nr:transglycosylase SLT domain-containing protein [Gammaproteobacteria bacterium]
MINAHLNLHSYWMLNMAIMLSFFLARSLLSMPIIKNKISQAVQLNFARHCLLFCLFLFSIAYIPNFIFMQETPLSMPHLFHPMTSIITHSQTLITKQLAIVNHTHALPPIKKYIFLLWLGGFIYFLYAYIKTHWTLHQLKKAALFYHKISRTTILFSQKTSVAFCYSNWRQHYIILPNGLLEKPELMRIALRHELQHLRQKDTYWLHSLAILKVFCFWNPFVSLWINWLKSLQEFACDEALILHKHLSPLTYAHCLIHTATLTDHQFINQYSVAMNDTSPFKLHRRITMLFNYKKTPHGITSIMIYFFSLFFIVTAAFAANSTATLKPISMQKLSEIITLEDNPLKISATPEVLAEINHLRSDTQDRLAMQAALSRMKDKQAYIESELKKKAMPTDLLVVPLVESGYQPLKQNSNAMHAAGIWQMIPETAKKYGLTITEQQDDRLNLQRSTAAALTYLQHNYQQFGDWKLAALAYEIGENETAHLIAATGSHNAWALVHSSFVANRYRDEFTHFLAILDASVVLMHHPDLLTA